MKLPGKSLSQVSSPNIVRFLLKRQIVVVTELTNGVGKKLFFFSNLPGVCTTSEFHVAKFHESTVEIYLRTGDLLCAIFFLRLVASFFKCSMHSFFFFFF